MIAVVTYLVHLTLAEKPATGFDQSCPFRPPAVIGCVPLHSCLHWARFQPPSPHQSQIGLLPFADRRLAGNFGFCQKREGSIINAGRNTFTSSLLFHKKRLSSRFTWYVYVFKGLLGNLNWAIGWGQQVTSYIFTDHQLGDSSLLQNKMQLETLQVERQAALLLHYKSIPFMQLSPLKAPYLPIQPSSPTSLCRLSDQNVVFKSLSLRQKLSLHRSICGILINTTVALTPLSIIQSLLDVREIIIFFRSTPSRTLMGS